MRQGLVLAALVLAAAVVEARAQDLEPRAFANTPLGLNFLIAGYSYSDGTVGTDPSAPLQDAEVTVNTAVLAYVRTFGLWGRSGKFNVILPYAWASGSATFAGADRSRTTSGLADPRFRVSMLFLGGPALSLDEFRGFQPDLIVGGSFEVTAPFGQYDRDKLLNVGTNRWSFKPELGVSQTWDAWTLEVTGGIRFYTENEEYLGRKSLQLSPTYSTQGHLIYSFSPGLWLGLDAIYYAGTEPDIDGRTGERNRNARVGLTCTLPVNIRNAVKLYGSTGVYSKTGTDFDIIGLNWQFRWGGGV